MKNIVNIINFVRAVEPRKEDNSFLISTLEEELKLCKKYNFKSTVLMQYDVLIRDEYIKLINEYKDIVELGLWFEIVEPLVIDCGLKWRGRFPWDWHNDVGFLVGYSTEERKMLIDKCFSKFNEIFGYLPKVIGSWHIDAFSLNYIDENYDVLASCNCKDQFGTDGYSIWGGYYNGAYYPSKNNMICPAGSKENQINIPTFRMLGSDPVRQYDLGIENPNQGQSVITLEPVYPAAGSDRKWVEWYLRENFNGKGLSMSYTQAGQENSFGWEKISMGLPMQFEILDRKLKNNEVEILTLGEAGKWFKENYETTPPASICVDNDIDGDCKTVWYYSKNYRTNIYYKNGTLRIRDLFIFDDRFKEKYIDTKELTNKCGYYNLPVMDGYRFSRINAIAGIYVCDKNGKVCLSDNFESKTVGEDTVIAEFDKKVKFTMKEDTITITSNIDDWYLEFDHSDECEVPYKAVTDNEIKMSFKGETDTYFNYSLFTEKGKFIKDSKIKVLPENGEIILKRGEKNA